MGDLGSSAGGGSSAHGGSDIGARRDRVGGFLRSGVGVNGLGSTSGGEGHGIGGGFSVDALGAIDGGGGGGGDDVVSSAATTRAA